MEHFVSFGFTSPQGSWSPKGANVEAENFDQAARLAREFAMSTDLPFGTPTRIFLTNRQFQGATYDYATLERLR